MLTKLIHSKQQWTQSPLINGEIVSSGKVVNHPWFIIYSTWVTFALCALDFELVWKITERYSCKTGTWQYLYSDSIDDNH